VATFIISKGVKKGDTVYVSMKEGELLIEMKKPARPRDNSASQPSGSRQGVGGKKIKSEIGITRQGALSGK